MIMKKLTTTLLSLCLCLTAAGIHAEGENVAATAMPAPSVVAPTAVAPAPATGIDPSLVFFTSLAKCQPGSYSERNYLAESVGPEFLDQTIYGLDQGYCNVMLTTPDDRIMQCSFYPEDLKALEDQHFLVGIITMTSNTPSKESVAADMLWSQLKNDNCSF